MIAKFDRLNLQAIRSELNAILERYCNEKGLEISIAGITYSEHNFEAKINAKITGAKSISDNILETVMNTYNLQKTGIDGRHLIGYNKRSYKYPFVYEQNGKKFKCSVESASKYFKK